MARRVADSRSRATDTTRPLAGALEQLKQEANRRGLGNWALPRPRTEITWPHSAELNRSGVTGVVDPSAGDFYNALYSLWRDKALTPRAAYRASALPADSEVAWTSTTLTYLPPLFGDDMLRSLGLGESLVLGMDDGVRMGPGFHPSQQSRDELFKVAMLAAERGYPLEIHVRAHAQARPGLHRPDGTLLQGPRHPGNTLPIAEDQIRWRAAGFRLKNPVFGIWRLPSSSRET